MPIQITKFYFGDNMSGTYYLEANKYNCSVLVFKRSDADRSKTYTAHFCWPAVYFLVNKESRKAYIGQTDNFQQRLQAHLAKKDFWDTAYAFIANDHSLSTTEVRYLESASYELARAAGRYDLSENGQAPQKPHVTYPQELLSDDFFKTIQLFSSDIGCDIFEPMTTRTSGPKANKDSARKSQKKEGSRADSRSSAANNGLKGKVKLTLDGDGPYTKSRFVHAVVKKYLSVHPTATLSELKAVFPKSLLGDWGRWDLIQENIEQIKADKSKTAKKARYCLDDKYILVSGDGIPFVVCTEWDYTNLPNILSIVDLEGWSYSIV